MKNILILFLFISVKSFSQDTSFVTNLTLQARVIEYLTPTIAGAESDSVLNVFLKWRTTFRATRPQGTDLVTTDSIPTTLLAAMYNYTMQNSEGFKMSAMMKTQIGGARNSNSYLDRLCSDYEQQFATRIIALRQAGRKLLLGK